MIIAPTMRRIATFRELSDRLDQVVGVPFTELRKYYSRSWTGEAKSNKGFSGNLVNLLLGADAGSDPEPDISSLGIEIKTIPIGDGPTVQWPTKVTSLNYSDLAVTSWPESALFHKLRAVLFVPIVKYDRNSPERWYIRRPFMWLPSKPILVQFEKDYNSIRNLVREHKFGDIHSGKPPGGQGVFLMAKPNAAKGNVRRVYEVNGEKFSLQPKAWMLRESFTQPIVEVNLRLNLELGGFAK